MDLRSLLARVEAAPPVAAADVVGAALEEMLGAREVSFLIADFSGLSLIRLGHVEAPGRTDTRGQETAERVRLAGTPHGRALASQRVEVVTEGDGARLLAPVTSRGEAVGVLDCLLADRPDEQTVADVALAAHALAYVVIANRRYTDLFEWGQRTMPLSLPAEIQRRLLPGSYTCEAGQLTLAGWLEPAGEVGGDTFDFALERDTLHLSITDSMGHTVPASLLATMLVGSLRNTRRRGVELVEQARLADEALGEHAAVDQFVTGQLVRVDLVSETALIVNAGHPLPVRLRSGRVEEIALRPDLPFGTLAAAAGYRAQTLPLAAGDRIVFLTDGLLERNAAGVDVAAILADGSELHPREAVQQLIRSVLKGAGGELSDDATALCLDWHGGPPRDRTPTGEQASGASLSWHDLSTHHARVLGGDKTAP